MSRSIRAVFGSWTTAASSHLGATKYKLMSNGEVVRGRFDAHGRLINEAVVEVIDPRDHAKFYSIIASFRELRAESPRRTRVGLTRRSATRRSPTTRRRSMSAGLSTLTAGLRGGLKAGNRKRDAMARSMRMRRYEETLPMSYVPPDTRLYGIVVGGRPSCSA